MTSGKRKAEAEMPTQAVAQDSDGYEAKLQRVAHALQDLTRVGEPFASGSCSRFPLPGLALKADGGNELLLPLGREDRSKIKVQGVVSQTQSELSRSGTQCIQTAWSIGGDQVEVHNREWDEFLVERLEVMRETMGIAPAAVVNITLRKLMLVASGGKIELNRLENTRGKGVFGTLVVVLPGAFEGGEIALDQGEREQRNGSTAREGEMSRTEHHKIVWQPAQRNSRYGFTYAAFYGHVNYSSQCVTCGDALCLMYDLVTTTPSRVPLFAGSRTIQDAIEESLAAFFETTPLSVAKRFKINPDAWRAIHEFAAERHFVYIVDGKTYEPLEGDDLAVAKSLKAFCDQSEGQYVLYLAKALCSQTRKISAADQASEERKVTLYGAWRKYNDFAVEEACYRPVYLQHCHEVAPLGKVNDMPLYCSEYENSQRDDIPAELHGDLKRALVRTTRALVILPWSIVLRLEATIPTGFAVKKLERLLSTSREAALRYARQIVYHRPVWRVHSHDNKFKELLEIVCKLDDCQLFNDLVLTLDMQNIDKEGVLRSIVRRFGWDSCGTAVIKSIRVTSTLLGRINLAVSTAYVGMTSKQIDPLLDALLELDPWTDVRVDKQGEYVSNSHRTVFARLLILAEMSSPEKLLQVVSVRRPEAVIDIVVPTLLDHVRRYRESKSMRAALLHVWTVLPSVKSQLANWPFARIDIDLDCDKCVELQAFLRSTETEARIHCTDPTQLQHVTKVIRRVSTLSANLRIYAHGTTQLGVQKELLNSAQIVRTVDQLENAMHRLLFPHGNTANATR